MIRFPQPEQTKATQAEQIQPQYIQPQQVQTGETKPKKELTINSTINFTTNSTTNSSTIHKEKPMNTTPEQIADLTKAHTSAHQDLLNFASSIQTRMTKLETDLQERTTQLETALQSQFIVAAPVGSLIVHAAQTPPSGWFECDGTTRSRTDYADLFNTIGTAYGEGDGSTTFNLPDLRGEFVRAWDHGRGVDANRALGTWQKPTVRAGNYDKTSRNIMDFDELSYNGENDVRDTFGYEKPGLNGYSGTFNYMQHAGAGAGSVPAESYLHAIRTRNVALMYCIKF